MADYGLITWDDAGNVLIDPSDDLGRVLGVTTTGSSNGSLQNAGFLLGTPFALVGQSQAASGRGGTYYPTPKVTFSGDQMSWVFSGPGAPTTIVYGVY